MVSVGISKLGPTDLIFVDPGLKINGGYYRDMLLLQQLLIACGAQRVRRPDIAPAHHARDTVRFLEQSTTAFIPVDMWPLNSTDVNAVDYKIWGDIQQRVYQLQVHNTDELRSVRWAFGMALTRASLTMQLTSAVSVFDRVCGQKADISSNCCKLDKSVVCWIVW